MKEAKGFKTISVKFSQKSAVAHQLFMKKHKVREESNDTPCELTLFVANIPPYFNEDTFKRLFRPCGLVKSVFFADVDTPSNIVKPSEKINLQNRISGESDEIKGYKVAYVVFYSVKDLEKALQWQPEEPPVLTDNEFTLVTGLRKYCQQYNDTLVDVQKMQEEVDQFMAQYDAEIKEKEVEIENNEPDEEGWVTVSKKGRNPGFARKQSVKDNVMKKIKKKRRRKELLNFYTFQIKESKINHLTALRKKMEQDKKRIEQLKARRMFKPF